METYVESLTESLTQPQFPEQRFLEDVEYDDTALEEMLHNAHRVHVYHSQREGLSVGQSSSSAHSCASGSMRRKEERSTSRLQRLRLAMLAAGRAEEMEYMREARRARRGGRS